MKYEGGRWWWLEQTSSEESWAEMPRDYLDRPWFRHDDTWDVLDEARELQKLNHTQSDFYQLIFRIVPYWEELLTTKPEEAVHRLNHAANQGDTRKWVWDTTVYAMLMTICDLRRESGEAAFCELERRLAHDEGGTARQHLLAIANLEGSYPEKCHGAVDIVTMACFAASWQGNERVYRATPADPFPNDLKKVFDLSVLLEDSRTEIRAWRAQIRRRIDTCSIVVALRRQEPYLDPCVILRVVSYCV